MNDKKLFSPKDVLFFALLLAVAGVMFFLFSLSPKAATAVVEKDGEVIYTQELSRLTEPYTLTVEGEEGISLTVIFTSDGAQVQESACPDQTCVRTGKITRAGETAICLPAKVSVTLRGAAQADAQTY